MKVKDLIGKLQQYDFNTHVSFIGYDGSCYTDNVCVCRPRFVHYKSVNELIIDLTSCGDFTEYDSKNTISYYIVGVRLNNEQLEDIAVNGDSV